MKTKILLTLFLSCFLLSCGDTCASFDSYDEFLKDQEEKGFVFLGRFKDEWPAKIIEERSAMNEISFEMKDGGKHRYPGYDGYKLKMVRLETSSGNEAVVVLRSKEKK